jgi:NADPH:quinone reductase-like Zn-dependent oxidoreductase
MRAATIRDGEVLVEEHPDPEPGTGQVLVRVRAAAVNPLDWHYMRGEPRIMRLGEGLRRPKSTRLGVDYAGVVEAVASDVSEFVLGEAVFGGRTGAFAEYVAARADRGVVAKPANVSFEEAAATPVAGLTALQGLRKGGLEAGRSVLINGASGGVGTVSIQVAKALGAEVTAVCSTRNVEQARALGADHVVDYTQEDFTRSERRYDLVFDVAGSRSWPEVKRVLSPRAAFVLVGGPNKSPAFGPVGTLAKLRLRSVGSGHKVVSFIAKFNKADMNVLREMLDAGQITPVIERRYELSQTAEALRHIGDGHARAKLVITA